MRVPPSPFGDGCGHKSRENLSVRLNRRAACGVMGFWSRRGARKVPDVPGRFLCRLTILIRPASPAPRRFLPGVPRAARPSLPLPPATVRQRVRELLERSAECTDPAEQQQYRRSVVTEYLPVARSLASRYSGSRRRALRSRTTGVSRLGESCPSMAAGPQRRFPAVRRSDNCRRDQAILPRPFLVGPAAAPYPGIAGGHQRGRADLPACRRHRSRASRSWPRRPVCRPATSARPGRPPRAAGRARWTRVRASGWRSRSGWGDEDPELRRVEDRVTVRTAAGDADRS